MHYMNVKSDLIRTKESPRSGCFGREEITVASRKSRHSAKTREQPCETVNHSLWEEKQCYINFG